MRIWNMLRFRGALRRGARTGLAGIGLKAAARRLLCRAPFTIARAAPGKADQNQNQPALSDGKPF